MPTIDYDFFTTEPGVATEMHCRVCGAACEVKREVYGPTSYVTAMAKNFRLHDVFVCPHMDETWHEQALRLVLAIAETPSKRVAELMKLDLEDMLRDHDAIYS